MLSSNTCLFQVYFLHIFIMIQTVKGLCPGGIESFDKVTGSLVENAEQKLLFSSAGNPVTAECNNRCRAASDCMAFIIDYSKEACFQMDFIDSATDDNHKLTHVLDTSRINYFQKVCFKVPTCEKAWAFERVPGYEISGFDDVVHPNVVSRVACQELCLIDIELPCRSAEYIYSTFTCRLSKQTRRSQNTAYRASTEDVDYLENQCSPPSSTSVSCEYQEFIDSDLGYADLQITASNKGECERRCDEMTAFVCRSFTFVSSRSVCRLSGDDDISAGPKSVSNLNGSLYYQRTPCVDLRNFSAFDEVAELEELEVPRFPRRNSIVNDTDSKEQVKLVCTADAMTVSLTTEDGFEGKLYALKSPRKCLTRGVGRTLTSLTFLYQVDAQRCGVERQDQGVYSNTIVVQHHPIIQQKGDRAIKIFCYFETGDKIVTSGYDVIADIVDPSLLGSGDTSPEVVTSVINGTAPSPSVILRITNVKGDDISGTKLGEPLFLRIEIRGDSIFDIFARNLVAKSGIDDETIQLIDDRGCPSDPVFPSLTKDPKSGALLGRFEAFKFSDTTVVNFQVNIQFCQGTCDPVECERGDPSYGRRRRRRRRDVFIFNSTKIHNSLEGASKLNKINDKNSNLNQEVIYHDTPLTKQIYVEPAVTVNSVKDPRSTLYSREARERRVFVEGQYENGNNIVCTSWDIVISIVSAFIFLQFSILVVCVLCIYSNKNKNQKSNYCDEITHFYESDCAARDSNMNQKSGNKSTAITGSSRSQNYRSHEQQNSISTLKSMRTSLRD